LQEQLYWDSVYLSLLNKINYSWQCICISLKKGNMKTIVIALLLLAFAPAILHAQQQQDPKSSGSAEGVRNQFMKHSKVIPISQMDQRKIYRWSDGEHATPTGRQAKDSSAKFARVYEDSAVIVRPSGEKKK
jgi:hypothetical protein